MMTNGLKKDELNLFRMNKEELNIFRNSIRRLAKERLAPLAEEIDEAGVFPWHVLDIFKQNDLLGLLIPVEYGGAGAQILAATVAVEEVARVCGNSASVLNVNSLAATPIILAGSEEQKRTYLPALARGETLGAFALTEPDSGSDTASISTTALVDGQDFVINGQKCFISNGDIATIYSLFVKTDPLAPGIKGISAILVRRDPSMNSGFTVDRIERKIGGSPIHATALSFENFRTPCSSLLGELNQGFYLAMKTLDKGRVTIAGTAVGKAQGALDLAVAYTRERVVFNQPLAKFQGIEWMLADMATNIEAARRLTYHAAELMDDNSPEASQASAMAKMFATDMAMDVTTQALQIHGGYGYMKDHPIQRFWREAKLGQIIEGTNQIQKIIIARNLIGKLRSGSKRKGPIPNGFKQSEI